VTAEQQKRSGFTLAEIMISMAILVIGVLSVISLTRFIIQGTYFNRASTGATFLAQDKLEDIRNLSWTNTVAGTDSTQNMTRSWSFVSQSGYKEVTVTVTWTGMDKRVRSTILKSMIAEP
jgi:prepilin-type N-terminal cleavage/methylation domain-containing protein